MTEEEEDYPEAVRRRVERMKRARRRGHGTWRSVAQMGALGFVFVLPLLLFTGAGWWLEQRHGLRGVAVGGVVLGTVVGALMAWREISRSLTEDEKEDR